MTIQDTLYSRNVSNSGSYLQRLDGVPTTDQSSIVASEGHKELVVGDWRKRIFDIVVAGFVLLSVLPLMLLVILLVKMASPGSSIYGHTRVGRNGKTFKCLKFRTMVSNGDEVLRQHLARDAAALREWEATRKLKDDPRVTPIGAILRQTSLDELPQLINVVRGEMSLVGPRPIVADELRHYGPYARQYSAARPGLTGLWQVSGRSDTSYEARVGFDRHYCENWTFGSDIRLIAKTIPVVLSRKGTY